MQKTDFRPQSKLGPGDQIEVHGFVMLKNLDPGRYRIKRVSENCGAAVYDFARPKGKKTLWRHYVGFVDPWVKPADDPDLNKIVKL